MLRCDWLVFHSRDWRVSILAVSDLLPRRSAVARIVVFLDRGHPRFWNFYSTVLVDTVMLIVG